MTASTIQLVVCLMVSLATERLVPVNEANAARSFMNVLCVSEQRLTLSKVVGNDAQFPPSLDRNVLREAATKHKTEGGSVSVPYSRNRLSRICRDSICGEVQTFEVADIERPHVAKEHAVELLEKIRKEEAQSR